MTWEDVDKMLDNLPEDISLLGAFLIVIERRCTKTQNLTKMEQDNEQIDTFKH